MAVFEPFAPDVEVSGGAVLSFINGVPPVFQNKTKDILINNGIENIDESNWYKQADWLNAFKQISTTIGANTLFAIGKSIPDTATFPPSIRTLRNALLSIDIAYQMNHRGGNIGYYKLLKFDEFSKAAEMECYNPYPCDFDRGIITAMSRRFLPEGSSNIEVSLHPSFQGKRDGEDKSIYKIQW